MWSWYPWPEGNPFPIISQERKGALTEVSFVSHWQVQFIFHETIHKPLRATNPMLTAAWTDFFATHIITIHTTVLIQPSKFLYNRKSHGPSCAQWNLSGPRQQAAINLTELQTRITEHAWGHLQDYTLHAVCKFITSLFTRNNTLPFHPSHKQ